MAEFLSVEENIREVFVDLNDIPISLIYKLEEGLYTFSAARFGFNDWKEKEYYYHRIPSGLMEQFPCLSYMLDDYWLEATRHTPLEEIEYRKSKDV